MLKYICIFSLLLFFVCYPCNAQDEVKNNFHLADSIFNRVIKEYNNNLILNYEVSYSGQEYFRGHWLKPNMTDSSFFRSTHTNDMGKFAINATTIYNNDTLTSHYSYTAENDSSLYKPFRGREGTLKKGNGGVFQYYLSPQNILTDISQNKGTLHIIESPLNSTEYILGFNDKLANKYYIYIDKESLRISQIIKTYLDWTDGDTFEKIAFANYERKDGLLFPRYISHHYNNNILRTLNVNPEGVTSISIDIKYKERMSTKFQMDTLAENLYLVKFLDLDNKTIVIKNDNYLSVFEATVNAVYSKQLIEFLGRTFPNNPIKYCYLTHHHPDHAGGLKSFNNIGSTIIAPENDIEYLKTVIGNQYRMSSIYDDNENEPVFNIIKKGEQKTINDGSQTIIAYEMDGTTHHAENFIVYYFPKHNILCTSDLVAFPTKSIWQQGKRAYSIYSLIKEKDIPTKGLKIVPFFPLHECKDSGTFSDLLNSLQKNYPDIK